MGRNPFLLFICLFLQEKNHDIMDTMGLYQQRGGFAVWLWV
jgi:hypothetical protein